MISSDDGFRGILYKQAEHAIKEPNHTFLNYMYGLVRNKLASRDVSEKIIEIGAGPGVSAQFLNHPNILHTDLLSWDDSKVTILPNIDAHSLPFSNGEFGVLFAVDTLHHLSDPISAIFEMERVVKNDGILVFIEPYVSFMSYPIYKLFHHERTSWSFSQKSFSSLVSNLAGDGDQGIPKFLFLRKEVIGQILSTSKFTDLEIQLFSPFSFFATGGLSNPLPVPRILIRILIKIESKIPDSLMKIIASRMMVTLRITK